jgi:hypothetical protein
VRPDDNAGNQISDDGGETEPACDRNAQDGGAQQDEPKIQKTKFAVLHD